MRGNITLTLNEATMKEAVQQYFDRQFAEGCAPVVTSVKATNQSYGAVEFTITVDDAKPEA